MLADILSVVAKALGFVCALQAAGVALFLALFGRELSACLDDIRRIGFFSAIAGFLFVAVQYGLESARMAGELAGMADPSLQRLVLTSTTAAAAALRLLGILLIASGLMTHTRLALVRGVAGAILVALSFTLTGHTSTHPERWLLAPFLALHLLVIELWFGALAPLYLICKRESPEAAARIVERFSRRATRIVPMIFVAGLILALILIPDVSVLGQPYGELLLAKVALFALLMALAAANKLRLGPAISRGDVRATRAFRQSVACEYLLIVAVLATTATMTSFFSPEP